MTSFLPTKERREQINRHGKERGRIIFRSNLCECLKIAQLQRNWMLFDDHRGISKTLRGLKFAFGIDHFCPPLTLRLGLFGDGALHLLRQINMFDLHQ